MLRKMSDKLVGLERQLHVVCLLRRVELEPGSLVVRSGVISYVSKIGKIN